MQIFQGWTKATLKAVDHVNLSLKQGETLGECENPDVERQPAEER